MGISLPWAKKEASGRLIYRRRYPDGLRDFLDEGSGKFELKVSLQAREMTPAAHAIYDGAKRAFEEHMDTEAKLSAA